MYGLAGREPPSKGTDMLIISNGNCGYPRGESEVDSRLSDKDNTRSTEDVRTTGKCQKSGEYGYVDC